MATSQAQSADPSRARGRAAKGLASAEWRERFDEIRARGIERGIDAPSPGISSLSVPVFDGDQRMQLALTAIGSSGSFDVEWDGAVARQLLETSRRITEAVLAPT
jgi:DNA-binding IclR family transcriptional regulator